MAVAAAREADSATHKRLVAEFGISNQEAEMVFHQVLAAPCAQVAVSTRELPLWIEEIEQNYSAGEDAREALHQLHARPVLSQAYAPPTNDLEEAIVAIWQELLGLDRVGIYDDFFELGGHSLLGTQVAARLREQYAVELPLRLLFEATTPQQLAERLRPLGPPGEKSGEQHTNRQEIEL